MGELLRVSFTGRGEQSKPAERGNPSERTAPPKQNARAAPTAQAELSIVSGNSHPLEGPALEHRRLWRLIWAGAPGIGWQRLQRLESMGGGLEQAWHTGAADLNKSLEGRTALPAAALAALDRYRQQLGPDPLSWPVQPQQRQIGRAHV